MTERGGAERTSETMRAVVITRAGGPDVLEVQQRPRPEPAPGEIRVRVRGSALNRADLLQRRGSYPPPAGAPRDIAGIEYAGIVEKLGPGAGMWPVGARVMGIVGGGGHAEYLCVHEREAVAVPDELSWEEASAVPEVFFTAYDALIPQLEVGMGDRVLIHAVASGVGTAALQLAAAAGATVIGTSRTASKLDRARGLGLHLAIDASGGDWVSLVERETGEAAITAVLELVGGAYVPDSLRVMAPRGRLLLVGLTAGSSAEIDLGLILRKRLRVTGTVLRSRPIEEKIILARAFSAAVLPMLASRRVRAVIDRVFPFEQIGEAHQFLESNESFGKVVLMWGDA